MKHLRTGVVVLVIAAVLVQFTACGYFFYPERRNQPLGGKIDLTVAILDGLGLLLFIIPGVIAYVVDFTTHTIYFPPGKKKASFESADKEKMIAIQVPADRFSQKTIESIVSEQAGKAVRLDSENVKVIPLENMTQVAHLKF